MESRDKEQASPRAAQALAPAPSSGAVVPLSSFPRDTAPGSSHQPSDTQASISAVGSLLTCGGFPSSITLDRLPSLMQSSFLHGGTENKEQHRFTLIVRQHATVGLALGDEFSSAKSSRVPPLDPPIVCELVAETPAGASLFGFLELALRATLVDGAYPDRAIGIGPAGLRPLHGDVDQSAFIAPIFSRSEQSLYIFSELVVRPAGYFRIRLDLVDRGGDAFSILGCVYTDPFVVVGERRSHPGLSPSTDLIQAIVRRGLKLRLIKSFNSDPSTRLKVKKSLIPSSSKRRLDSSEPPYPESASSSTLSSSIRPVSRDADFEMPERRPKTPGVENVGPSRSVRRTILRSSTDTPHISSDRISGARLSLHSHMGPSSSDWSSAFPPATSSSTLRSAASYPRMSPRLVEPDMVRQWEQPRYPLPPVLSKSLDEHPSRIPTVHTSQLPPLQTLPHTYKPHLPSMGRPSIPSYHQHQEFQQHQQQHSHWYPHLPQPTHHSHQQYHLPHQQQQHTYEEGAVVGPPPIQSGSYIDIPDEQPSLRPRLPSIHHVFQAAGEVGPRPPSRGERPSSLSFNIPLSSWDSSLAGGEAYRGGPSAEGSGSDSNRSENRPTSGKRPWEYGYR